MWQNMRLPVRDDKMADGNHEKLLVNSGPEEIRTRNRSEALPLKPTGCRTSSIM
jgi:hypothetical protein